MAKFSFADAYAPDVWLAGIAEKIGNANSLMTSSAVFKSPTLDAFASGPSNLATIPFFKDISGQADEIQVESTAPSSLGLATGKQVAHMLNRVTKNVLTAEGIDLGHDDPVSAILAQLARRRLAQRQTKVVNVLRGVFGTALAANSVNHFSETSNTDADKIFLANYFHDATAKLGINDGEVVGGAVFAHPIVIAGMKKADEIDFVKASDGKAALMFYKGLPLFSDSRLARAGTTSGTVYDTYILAPNSIGYGAKAQEANQAGQAAKVGVATFNLVSNGDTNEEYILDRTRELVHIDGTKWTGTPSGATPTDAELATAGNWALAYGSASQVPVVRIRTNG